MCSPHHPYARTRAVEKLTDDFTASTLTNYGFFGASGVEAPTLFRRGATLYALFGACCCYCEAGSPVVVHTAPSPQGPWTTRNTLDAGAPAVCRADVPYSRQGGAHGRGDCGTASNIHAQQTDVLVYTDDAGAAQALWYGDGWQQAPDGLKGHDPLYTFPLTFAADGNITAMSFVPSFNISVSTP